MVCKPEYCEMDVWKKLIADFKAAGTVTVLGSVDSAATLALYAGLDLDGFYFTYDILTASLPEQPSHTLIGAYSHSAGNTCAAYGLNDLTLQECIAVAAEFGYVLRSNHYLTNSHDPPGCFTTGGGVMWWHNSNSNSIGMHLKRIWNAIEMHLKRTWNAI